MAALKRFAYYEALGAESKRTYRKSDALLRIAVPGIESLVPLAKAVEPDEVTGGVARISVWMRTAQRVQVVRFRTFLRTLIHEVVHHLDYELYKLPETFHTQGFYACESALMRELLGEEPAK